jgi:hypothetical protein
MVVASGIDVAATEFSVDAFTFSATGNDVPRRLVPIGRTLPNGFAYTAISADRILIGDDEDPTGLPGSAYLFDRASGEQIAKLTAPDAIAGRDFWYGQHVELTPNFAVVMAADFDADGVYVYDAANGDFLRKIPFGGIHNGPFSLATNSRFALVEDNTAESAYMFDLATGELITTFSDPFPGDQHQFGLNVALSEEYAAIAHGARNQTDIVSVFDVESGDLLSVLNVDAPFPPASLDMDGDYLILSGRGLAPETPTRIFDVVRGIEVAELPHAASVAIDGQLAVLGPEWYQDQRVLVYMLVPEPSSIAAASICVFCAIAWILTRRGSPVPR